MTKRLILVNSISRRTALMGITATTALATLQCAARAQTNATIRWWSPQGSPAQIATTFY